MNKIVSTRKNESLEAIVEYRESILTEFLDKAKTLCVMLKLLEGIGYDYIERENVEFACTTVKQDILRNVQVALASMEDKRAIETFFEIYTDEVKSNLWAYQELLDEMSQLACAYDNTKKAEELLEKLL